MNLINITDGVVVPDCSESLLIVKPYHPAVQVVHFPVCLLTGLDFLYQ